VDDILLIGDNMELVRDTKSLLSKAFDMKDLGAVHYCLGIEVKRDRKNRKIWLSQKKYIENILNEFGMETCKVVKTLFKWELSCLLKCVLKLMRKINTQLGYHMLEL
jgi:hypothetical protein